MFLVIRDDTVTQDTPPEIYSFLYGLSIQTKYIIIFSKEDVYFPFFFVSFIIFVALIIFLFFFIIICGTFFKSV